MIDSAIHRMSPRQQLAADSAGLANLPFGSGYAAHGCTVNRATEEALFEKYAECGFLYEAKLQRLKPHWGLIVSNWRRSMSSASGDPLHQVVVYDRPDHRAWASVTYWATTDQSVHSQHLVSIGKPEASRAVLLSAQSEIAAVGRVSIQNWFRAENRFPQRVFGSIPQSLGPRSAVVRPHRYFALDRTTLPVHAAGVSIHRCSDADSDAIRVLADRICGPVQARADEWARGDLELSALDARYREVGLRRYRRVFIATTPGAREPVGFAIAHRGPLGLNFSFLENRCEIWIDPSLDAERMSATTARLASAAEPVYADFELLQIPIVCDAFAGPHLERIGARLIQNYSRSVWLENGFPAWYAHVSAFYARVISAGARRAGAAMSGVPV